MFSVIHRVYDVLWYVLNTGHRFKCVGYFDNGLSRYVICKSDDQSINVNDDDVVVVLLVQMLLLTISYYTAMLSKNYYTTPDVIAIVFCSTHKSLTLGEYEREKRWLSKVCLSIDRLCSRYSDTEDHVPRLFASKSDQFAATRLSSDANHLGRSSRIVHERLDIHW